MEVLYETKRVLLRIHRSPADGSRRTGSRPEGGYPFSSHGGTEKFACGQTYSGIGTTGSKLSPHDFRFYVHNVALIDESGKAVPVQLDQDGKWQLDDTALLDFENAAAACVNGTPDINDRVSRHGAGGPLHGAALHARRSVQQESHRLDDAALAAESHGPRLGLERGT